MDNILEKKLKQDGKITDCPVAVIVRDEKILLGHRHYNQHDNKLDTISVWTAPGGRADESEKTIEETLRREVVEEIGITDLNIVDYIDEIEGAKKGDNLMTFLCLTDENPELKEPEKFSEWKWFSIADYCDGMPENYINEESRVVIGDYLKEKFYNKNND